MNAIDRLGMTPGEIYKQAIDREAQVKRELARKDLRISEEVALLEQWLKALDDMGIAMQRLTNEHDLRLSGFR